VVASPEDIIQAIYDAGSKGLRVSVVSGGPAGTIELGPASLSALEEVQVNVTGEGGIATETTLAALLQWLDDHHQEIVDLVPTILAVLVGGAREHAELASVPSAYDPAQCKVEFSEPKTHVRVHADDDVYWVDSAADDSDAGTKLTTAGQRGLILKRVPFEITMYPGITRLDFLAIAGNVAVHVTGT